MPSISNGESGSSVRTKLNVALGGVQYLLTTVTSAQILNLASVPLQIIATPGAGKAILVLGCISSLGGSIDYTVPDTVALIYGSVFSGAVQAVSGDASSGFAGEVQFTSIFGNAANFRNTKSKFENQPIYFSGGSSNPTLGDGDIKLTLTYIIVDV